MWVPKFMFFMHMPLPCQCLPILFPCLVVFNNSFHDMILKCPVCLQAIVGFFVLVMVLKVLSLCCSCTRRPSSNK